MTATAALDFGSLWLPIREQARDCVHVLDQLLQPTHGRLVLAHLAQTRLEATQRCHRHRQRNMDVNLDRLRVEPIREKAHCGLDDRALCDGLLNESPWRRRRVARRELKNVHHQTEHHHAKQSLLLLLLRLRHYARPQQQCLYDQQQKLLPLGCLHVHAQQHLHRDSLLVAVTAV